MVENAPLPPGTRRYDPAVVQNFIASALRAAGVATEDAALVAEVLVGADLRGVRSHGAARVTYFLNFLERGHINVAPKMTFAQKTDTTGVLDADNGLGIIAAGKAMDEAMKMAAKHGTGFVGMKNSSHFGYAGYWAERAMRKGFIGISMSNSGGRTTPTFGSEGMLGTNPFSVAIGGGAGGTDFLLDMATTTVASARSRRRSVRAARFRRAGCRRRIRSRRSTTRASCSTSRRSCRSAAPAPSMAATRATASI
jgi:L-2-hydroxycarboxylate dehydrogenase (NAD+)